MSRTLCIFIILALGIQLAEAQRYPKRKILRDLEELPGFENAFIGLKLYDPARDKVIAEQYADKNMTPASNTKLFTLWAANKLSNFNTIPALEYIEKGDSLIFWSTAYPLTLHPDHQDTTVISFLRSSSKQLFYWPRPTEDSRFGPGWGWDDYLYYFGTEKSTFPIFGNSIRFILNSKNKTYEMSPKYDGFKINVLDENSQQTSVTRDEFWNEFEIKFKKINSDTEQVIDTLIRPFRYSNSLFIDLLGREVNKNIELLNTFERPEHYQSLQGVPADSLYKWMIQPSDNLFAESILMMISGFASDTLSTKSAIELIGMEKLNWVDGSGLSRYNMFSPSLITDFLIWLYGWYGDAIYDILPQGGVNGTLKDWYKGENGPYVFAKTGTLSNNHALSGFIKTKAGRTLVFSIMANHYDSSTKTIRESIGIILEKIYKAY